MYPPLDPSSYRDLVDRFQARTLEAALWTHQAHLVVGLSYVREHGETGALTRLRRDIWAFNAATGVPNSDTRGYHETLTTFHVRAIACYLDASPSRSLAELAQGLFSHALGDKRLPERFYSRELLYSVEARRGWVAPDLRPLDDLRLLR